MTFRLAELGRAKGDRCLNAAFGLKGQLGAADACSLRSIDRIHPSIDRSIHFFFLVGLVRKCSVQSDSLGVLPANHETQSTADDIPSSPPPPPRTSHHPHHHSQPPPPPTHTHSPLPPLLPTPSPYAPPLRLALSVRHSKRLHVHYTRT